MEEQNHRIQTSIIEIHMYLYLYVEYVDGEAMMTAYTFFFYSSNYSRI